MHTGNSLKTSLSYDFDFSVKDYFFKMSLWELLSSSSSSLLIQISGIFFLFDSNSKISVEYFPCPGLNNFSA
jgi:hypothetical protein